MNLWDVCVSAALLAIVAFAVRRTVRSRGRCAGCSGDCAHCAARASEKER